VEVQSNGRRQCHRRVSPVRGEDRVPKNRWGSGPSAENARPHRFVSCVSGRSIEASDYSFSREVLDFPAPVLVELPCSVVRPLPHLGPVLDELARQYAGKVKFVEINVDNNRSTASTYGIRVCRRFSSSRAAEWSTALRVRCRKWRSRGSSRLWWGEGDAQENTSDWPAKADGAAGAGQTSRRERGMQRVRTVGDLAERIAKDPDLEKRIKENPIKTIAALFRPVQTDVWVFRIVVITLGLVVLGPWS